jgi:hypothetical protein
MPQDIQPTHNLTAEARRDRSRFSRAMIYAGVFFILALCAALILVKARGKQIAPGNSAPHTVSLTMANHPAPSASA